MAFNDTTEAPLQSLRRRFNEEGGLSQRGLGGHSMTGLTSTEQQWKKSLFQRTVKMIDLSLLVTMQDAEAREQIRKTAEALMTQDAQPFNSITRQRIVKEIQDEILGLGPLEPLLAIKKKGKITK